MKQFTYKPTISTADSEAKYYDLQKRVEAAMTICSYNMRQYLFYSLSPPSLKTPLLLPDSSFTENLVMFKVLSVLRGYLHHLYRTTMERVMSLPIKKDEQRELLQVELSAILEKFKNLNIEVVNEIVSIHGVEDSVFISYIKKLGNVEGFKVVSRKVSFMR